MLFIIGGVHRADAIKFAPFISISTEDTDKMYGRLTEKAATLVRFPVFWIVPLHVWRGAVGLKEKEAGFLRQFLHQSTVCFAKIELRTYLRYVVPGEKHPTSFYHFLQTAAVPSNMASLYCYVHIRAVRRPPAINSMEHCPLDEGRQKTVRLGLVGGEFRVAAHRPGHKRMKRHEELIAAGREGGGEGVQYRG